MDGDVDSPVARVERTLWTVWCYITEAVNRFLHQQPTNNVSSDPNSVQNSALNSEPADSGHTGGDASAGGVEQLLVPASRHRSSGVVAWDIGHQCETQLSRETEREASEEKESEREEPFHQTGNDDGGHSRAKKGGEGEEQAHEKVETAENDGDGEHTKMGPLTLTEDDTGVKEEESMTEPAHCQTGQEEGVQTGAEEEKDILTVQGTCTGDVSANAKTELHPAEEQEDVAKLTETTEAGYVNASNNEKPYAAATDVLVDEMCLKKAQVEEERLSSEEDDKRSNMEITCTVPAVTVNLHAETAQETCGELENIPLRMCEGQVVVSPGLNSPTCEETQEGVPEYNNKPGPDENTSQKFLEVGDCGEIQTTQLPEEVESLQNSSSATAADCLLVKEREEEERGRAEDTGSPQNSVRRLAEKAIPESGLLFENKEGNILVHSMKTEIEDLENILAHLEQETGEKLRDSRDAAGESRDGTGAVGAGEVFGFANETSKPINTEVENIMDVSVRQESADVIYSDQNCDMLPSLLEDIAKSVLLEESVETEPKVHRGHTAEMQDAVIDVEGGGGELEEGAAENAEMHSKNWVGIFNEHLAEFAGEPVKDSVENQRTPTAESEFEAFEISAEEMLANTDATDLRTAEFKSNDSAVEKPVASSEGSDAEEASRGHQDVIDEEILDLWIQAVSSEDKQQEEPEHAQQIQQSHEEQAGVSSEMAREQLVESSSGESGFHDQSLTGEWDTHSSEAQLPSFQDRDDMFASISETTDMPWFSQQQSKSEFQDVLMEQAAEIEQSHLKEEESISKKGFMSPEERQEPSKSQEISDADHVEAEMGTREEPIAKLTDLKIDTEEEDIESQISGEKGDGVKVPRLESVTTTHDEITHNEYGRTTSGSELLLEEEIKSTQSSPESETLLKLPSLEKAWPECSEDFVEVLGQPTTHSECPFEVEASSLDFTAQRSRIALKNPRVRPPRDPRSLLHMPSLEPTPSSHVPVKAPAGVPLGMGIKLPGFGAGFPALKKTQSAVRDENSKETSREPETKPEDKSDPPKHDEVQQKPKWMPPKHPGFGSPLMSELKTKLKKNTKE